MRRFPERLLTVVMETVGIVEGVLMFGGLRPPGPCGPAPCAVLRFEPVPRPLHPRRSDRAEVMATHIFEARAPSIFDYMFRKSVV